MEKRHERVGTRPKSDQEAEGPARRSKAALLPRRHLRPEAVLLPLTGRLKTVR